MRKKLTGMIASCALAAGCAGPTTNVPQASKQVDPPAVSLSSIPPAAVASSDAGTSPVPAQPEAKSEAQTATQPVPAATTIAAKPPTVPNTDAATKILPAPHAAQRSEIQATTGGAVKPAAPPKVDAKTASEKPAAAEPVRSAPPAPAARVAEPTLDVAELKTRLRETHAIGTFTKLALKNQMDDLLDRFRAVYQNGQRTSVAALRQPFDALVVKVLTQLRPGDPTLARSIESSREAIWGILSDPEKFKSIT